MIVSEQDLPELLPLMRAYCDFYRSHPSDEALLTISRALIDDPEREGVQVLSRDDDGAAVGFANVFLGWETNGGGRIVIMNDLFVVETWRGDRGGGAPLSPRAPR